MGTAGGYQKPEALLIRHSWSLKADLTLYYVCRHCTVCTGNTQGALWDASEAISQTDEWKGGVKGLISSPTVVWIVSLDITAQYCVMVGGLWGRVQ